VVVYAREVGDGDARAPEPADLGAGGRDSDSRCGRFPTPWRDYLYWTGEPMLMRLMGRCTGGAGASRDTPGHGQRATVVNRGTRRVAACGAGGSRGERADAGRHALDDHQVVSSGWTMPHRGARDDELAAAPDETRRDFAGCAAAEMAAGLPTVAPDGPADTACRSAVDERRQLDRRGAPRAAAVEGSARRR